MSTGTDEATRPDVPARRLLRVGLVACLVAVLVGAAAWWTLRSSPPPDALVLYGNVDVREVDVAFNEGDRIVAMHVEEGDSVEAGQLLAELDDARLEHAMLSARAQVAAQRAVVSRFERGSRPEEIERARADLDAAQADLSDARATYERLEKLVRAEAASPQQLDDARAAHLAARARLRVAQEDLRLAVEGPRTEDTEAARAKLLADENALELARTRLEDTKLYAPAAGTILTRILEPGAVVLPNTPAYTLALRDPVWVRAYLSESDLGRVFSGMEAEISSDSFPDRTYAGWVGFISPTAEFTPKPVETPDLRTSLVYRTRIFVHDPDQTLRQGMPVTVRLALGQQPPEPRPTAPAPTADRPARTAATSDERSAAQETAPTTTETDSRSAE